MSKNRQNHDTTGLTLTGLPKLYTVIQPETIIIHFSEYQLCASTKQKAMFDITFTGTINPDDDDETESTGYLNVDLEHHPQNVKLVELIEEMCESETALVCYGCEHNRKFYIKAIWPASSETVSEEVFFFLLKKMGITFEYPESKEPRFTAPMKSKAIRLCYRLFIDTYPESIRRWIDEHIDSPNDWVNVKRFIEMHWTKPALQLPSAEEAKQILDNTVYGMESVKRQLLIFLERLRRSGNLATNLLLVGPAGVGKTTVVQAVAKMLGLPLSILSMAALQDAEAFCGFGKTYNNAQEGLLTTTLLSPLEYREDGTAETVHQIGQVLFLNELDKVNAEGNNHGSVQSALLRMLDDNRTFFDVYHQVSIPLEYVCIIADANDTSLLQKPLLDRFQVIEVPGYTVNDKTEIFNRFAFPEALHHACVDPAEVDVTAEAVKLIASRDTSTGARQLRHVSDQIIGDYLLCHAGTNQTVQYTPEMVEPFLPKIERRQTALRYQPGSINAIALCGEMARQVAVQCAIRRARSERVRIYGTTDQLLQQELEAAISYAVGFLPDASYDVQIQLYGLPADANARGQLSFPVLIALLSAFYEYSIKGQFHGGVTLLGGMTSASCNAPDPVLEAADEMDEAVVYTACGFSDRVKDTHTAAIMEFLDAQAAVTALFGDRIGLRAS